MVASSPNHTACCTTGSVFLRIPCSLTFPCWPLKLVNWWSNRWNKSQYYTAGACFEVILCCTSGFKANCMHQSLLSCSKNGLGPADRSNHKSGFHNFLGKDGWEMMVASSPNLTLHAVQLGQYFYEFPAAWPFHVDRWNWWIGGQTDEKKANTIRPEPVWKWFYAAHQVLKLIVCIKACFLAQRMALDRPIDQTIKVSLNPSFHNFLGKDGWEMMVASSPNHTACWYNWGSSISTNSLQLDLSMLTLKLMNWSKPWKNLPNTIRPEPV